MSLFSRRKPNLRVVSNESQTTSRTPYKEIIITAGVTALAVAIVGDFYRGAKKRLNADTEAQPAQNQQPMVYQQQPQQYPQQAEYSQAPQGPPPAAPPSNWETDLKDRARILKERQKKCDEREDDLLRRERLARLME